MGQSLDVLRNRLEYKVDGSRPRDRSKKTWREVVEKDCQARKLNRRMLWILVDGGSS